MLLFNETGTYTTPTGSYAMMYIAQGTANGGYKTLMSDPIECQAPDGSLLSLR